MSSTIEDLTDFQAQNIAVCFGNFARDKVNQMSTDNINALCANVIDNADNESGLTIVVKQPPDIVRD